jgi:hypothetical protein
LFGGELEVAQASKVWRCEWLITGETGGLEPQKFGIFDALKVKKWKDSPDGLRAPRGKWLEFKGGFVDDAGVATPSKPRSLRAK